MPGVPKPGRCDKNRGAVQGHLAGWEKSAANDMLTGQIVLSPKAPSKTPWPSQPATHHVQVEAGGNSHPEVVVVEAAGCERRGARAFVPASALHHKVLGCGRVGDRQPHRCSTIKQKGAALQTHPAPRGLAAAQNARPTAHHNSTIKAPQDPHTHTKPHAAMAFPCHSKAAHPPPKT